MKVARKISGEKVKISRKMSGEKNKQTKPPAGPKHKRISLSLEAPPVDITRVRKRKSTSSFIFVIPSSDTSFTCHVCVIYYYTVSLVYQRIHLSVPLFMTQ